MEESVDPNALQIPEHVLRVAPADVAHRERALPIGIDGDVLILAVEDSHSHESIERLRFVFNREVRLVRAPGVSLTYAIWRHYGPAPE